MNKLRIFLIPILLSLGFIFSGTFYLFDQREISVYILNTCLLVGCIPILYGFIKDFSRKKFGVDLIGIVAIVTSILLQEYIAGAVIVLMMSGGESLEAYASKRAKHELTKLLSLAPTIAHVREGDELMDAPVDQVKIGQRILIKTGEIIPVDGVVTKGASYVDEASITGESEPILKDHGEFVFSGSINKTAVLEIRSTSISSESQYQRIVTLVKNAQEQRSPFVRLADRYAVLFSIISFGLSFGAWIFSGNAMLFLAVLVVATPCPLILAVPIALLSGMSKCASRGIIVKNGTALENLGAARGFVFDKTGTLTLGEPVLQSVVPLSEVSQAEIVRIAASLDQLSLHLFARSLVKYATENQIPFDYPEDFSENIGSGVRGKLDGREYFFGKLSFLQFCGVNISDAEEKIHVEQQEKGIISVYLSINEQLVGKILFEDKIRPEVKEMFEEIQHHQIDHMYMMTGDKAPVANKIAKELGIINVRAEMKPEDKLNEIHLLKSQLHPIVMVGDGINDAPAMAAADVSIALAAYGSSASSEASDIVIMKNDMLRVHDVLHISQRVMHISRQCIYIGIGVSIFLMILAAFGQIPPVWGAVLQESLDVVVIMNALRLSFEDIS